MRKLGFIFTADGCMRIPEKISVVDDFGSEDSYFMKRGIRQHINFPMDISSHSLPEAEEYVRNLARMGFNFITFHSYPEQWYQYEKDGKEYYAGHFFYSEPHRPQKDGIVYPLTGNREYFMIPEFEKYAQDETELGRKAVCWLRTVMEAAKKYGMEVRLSLELRGGKTEENIKICEDVVKQYPDLDSLELITQECGTFGPISWKKDEIRDRLYELFGSAAEDQEIDKYMHEDMLQLPVTMQELKASIDTIEALRKQGFPVPLACGIYATDSGTLNLALYFMRKLLPGEVEMTFLSAHGAQAVADNLKEMDLTPEGMQRCMIYSWAEFDGNMYILQSEIYGLEECIRVIDQKSGGQPYGLAVNHWRTAENTLTLSWAASGTCQRTEVTDFLSWYADQSGAGSAEQLIKSVDALEQASHYARYHLFNIGFCYLGCWTTNGLGYVGNWKGEEIRHGIALYIEALQNFEKMNGENGYVSLMKNRTECSILYLNAMQTLAGLQELYGKEEMEGYGQMVEDICSLAGFFAQSYLRLHCTNIADRGCVGTAVSYEHLVPEVIAYVRGVMLGDEGKTEDKKDVDEPPSPAIYE